DRDHRPSSIGFGTDGHGQRRSDHARARSGTGAHGADRQRPEALWPEITSQGGFSRRAAMLFTEVRRRSEDCSVSPPLTVSSRFWAAKPKIPLLYACGRLEDPATWVFFYRHNKNFEFPLP